VTYGTTVGKNLQEAGEEYIMNSFTILLGWSNQGGWNGWGM